MRLEITIDRSGDDLLGGSEAFERFDFGGAGFLEVFVMIEMKFDLLDGLFREIL